MSGKKVCTVHGRLDCPSFQCRPRDTEPERRPKPVPRSLLVSGLDLATQIAIDVAIGIISL